MCGHDHLCLPEHGRDLRRAGWSVSLGAGNHQLPAGVLDQRVQDINFGEAQGEAFSDGKVVIKIPCLGSGEVKNCHLARHHETRTTDSQGQLVIYMIKQDGQWFWNPFGW